MVALVRSRGLDFAGELPDSARRAIKDLLAAEPSATRKVYAALARKVWSLLIERRLDDEIKDWHILLSGVKAHIRTADTAAAERITTLADLLRESISLAESSPAHEAAARPRARAILDLLHAQGGFVKRRLLLDKLEVSTSNLSNVLTQLVAHNLIERRGNGKEADFSLTPLGLQVLGKDGSKARPSDLDRGAFGGIALLDEKTDLLSKQIDIRDWMNHLTVADPRVGTTDAMPVFPSTHERQLAANDLVRRSHRRLDRLSLAASA